MEQKNNKYYSYISEYYAANPTKFEKRKNNLKPVLYLGLAVVGGGFGGVLGMFLGVPIFACINSLVHWFTDRTLAKKGVTDDALFDPAPIPPADEKKD